MKEESSKNGVVESVNGPYRWDYFSDQPYTIKDMEFKSSIRKRALLANLKMLGVSLLVFPLLFYRSLLVKRVNTHKRLDNKIGVCVNLDKEPEKTLEWLNELGIRQISIRIPLSDVANIESYYNFARQFEGFDILFVILQDREHIENREMLESSLSRIFEMLAPVSKLFQVGNAINRTKWGFISIDEYLGFFSIAQKIRDSHFTDLQLIGSAVIDFEVYSLIRSLWNGFSMKYDGVAALLYVDRRGAPENKQFIFDLIGKINFFWVSVLSSRKSSDRLFITETNWPIQYTKPYAPAADDVWVSEDDYANFMLRYFLLSLANGNAECIYWHQLVSPGYGLIDNRNGEIRKRKAFYMLKRLVEVCRNARIIDVDKRDGVYTLFFKNTLNQQFRVLWSFESKVEIVVPENLQVISAAGKPVIAENNSILLGQEPVYFVEKARQIF